MDEAMHARRDLAFIKAVAEDKGALPSALGWHLIAIGVIFGLEFIHIWAVFTDRAPWPDALRSLPWLPGLVAYIPANLLINLRGRHMAWGPTARACGAAWAAMGLMIVPAVAVLIIGQMQAGYPFFMVWPALAFVLYGGAWIVVAMIRGGVCALLIRDAAQWLVLAAGMLTFVALPGVAMLRVRRERGDVFT
jgi:hypothetical protein